METFPTKGILTELDAGGYHRILDVSPKLVAKVPLSSSITVSKLRQEYKTMKSLYDSGISVPLPYGVYRVVVNPFEKISDPSIIMQRIYGVTVDLLEGALRNRAERLMEQELEKVSKVGFSLWDPGAHNTRYSPLHKKVYLIDFQPA